MQQRPRRRWCPARLEEDSVKDWIAGFMRAASPASARCSRENARLWGLELIFLVVSRAVALRGLSRRESWWKTAEILILRHQLAVLQRRQPRRTTVDWAKRALFAILLGVTPKLNKGRKPAMRRQPE